MTANRVRETIETTFGDDGFRHVRIDDAAIDDLAEELDVDTGVAEYREAPYPPDDWADETVFDLFVLIAANAFQFIMEDAPDTYRATYDGRTWEGMFGLVAGLTQAVEDGVPVTDGEYLRDASLADTRDLFAGDGSTDTEIPMVEARHELHTEIGERLCAGYDGHFHDLLPADAPVRLFGDDGFVEALVSDVPEAFEDIRTLDGRTVAFDKKAQLAATYAYGRFQDDRFFSPPDADQLTLLSDYVVPANLRAKGVLVYDDHLARLVDAATELPEGSREEIEIRASAVRAGDRLVAAMGAETSDGPLVPQVDYQLWKLGRDLDVPYHVTHTTTY